MLTKSKHTALTDFWFRIANRQLKAYVKLLKRWMIQSQVVEKTPIPDYA